MGERRSEGQLTKLRPGGIFFIHEADVGGDGQRAAERDRIGVDDLGDQFLGRQSREVRLRISERREGDKPADENGGCHRYGPRGPTSDTHVFQSSTKIRSRDPE